ncbi:MAG: homoserine kinase [Rhodospirillaceae bacterium]|nr:homoserine kinase [Rhodospirillaceae bacterium]MYB13149.1 homoserine kinase [Rhodospirillaceae bacterium]MYI48293.1 homoserine kinase [Rhodospirillaceae bacterium]
MAVYTQVADDELAAFLDAYDIGAPVSYKGIAEGVENSNYFLQTERGSFILTLYEKRVDPADLPFFLGLMDHLAARDIACPTPIHARDGEALRTLAGRPAAIISFLQGVSPRRVDIRHCAPLGGALAGMHLAADGFAMARPNALSLAGWRPLFDRCGPRAHEVQNGLAGEIEQELEFLEENWPADLPTGVIHADLFPDNVFFLGDRVSGLIDFYFACNDYFAYDLAICINAWCFEKDGSFNVTKARHMLNAYRAVRPFSAAELAAIPVLLRGGALRFLLTRLHDWLFHPEGALVTPHNPLEYHRKLRFHQGVKRPGELGLE